MRRHPSSVWHAISWSSFFLSPQAWQLTARHTYQVWHALIVAVCAEHGVKTLYSEDAGALKRPLGVHVVNPFAKLEID